MPAIKQILFPVDFSEPCRRVAPLVDSLTRHFEARLILIHSVGVPPDSRMSYAASLSSTLIAQLRAASCNSMQAFVQQEFGSVPIRSVIQEGDPAQMIVDYARKEAIDLVMIP